MSTVNLGGKPIRVEGNFPKPGQTAPAFSLVNKDLEDITLESFAGKRKILNIVPSLDTPTCAKSTIKLNEAVNKMKNAVVLVIASDLPFAMSRFCGNEGLNHVITLSTMRGRDFHKNYGVMIMDPPLRGVTARALIVLDEANKVLHAELVSEIKDEPNYDAALAALAS